MNKLQQLLLSLNYATTQGEAQVRYENTCFKDPLPNVTCALLNRIDIAQYVAKTGMIHPFDWQKLKSASYEAELGGEVLYWDEKGQKKHLMDLSTHQAVKLSRNSIAYVGLNVHLRLPIYIAVRFNLAITHVHRGLLLGTGPIVDPGYHGHLMIPIHNLTNNDYVIYPGDKIVAIEFTKISMNDYWNAPQDKMDTAIKDELRKNVKTPNKTFATFLGDALPVGVDSVRSFIGIFIADAERKLERIERRSQYIAWGALIALVVALLSIYGLIHQVHKYVTDTRVTTDTKIQQIGKAVELLKQKPPISVQTSKNNPNAQTTEIQEPKKEIEPRQNHPTGETANTTKK